MKNEQAGADDSLMLASQPYVAEIHLLGIDPLEGLEREGYEFVTASVVPAALGNSSSGKRRQKPAIFIHSIRYTGNRDKKSNATAPVAFRILQGIWMLIILNGTPEIPR